jgi:hypothetical protein
MEIDEGRLTGVTIARRFEAFGFGPLNAGARLMGEQPPRLFIEFERSRRRRKRERALPGPVARRLERRVVGFAASLAPSPSPGFHETPTFLRIGMRNPAGGDAKPRMQPRILLGKPYEHGRIRDELLESRDEPRQGIRLLFDPLHRSIVVVRVAPHCRPSVPEPCSIGRVIR